MANSTKRKNSYRGSEDPPVGVISSRFAGNGCGELHRRDYDHYTPAADAVDPDSAPGSSRVIGKLHKQILERWQLRLQVPDFSSAARSRGE